MGHGMKQSELYKLEDRAYNQLKEGIYRTNYAGGVFKCPFCVEKKSQEYTYDDVLQHACMRGKGSNTSSLKQQAQHMALSSYLRKYCRPKAPSKLPNEVSSHGGCDKRDTSLSTSEEKMHTGKDKICETRPRKMQKHPAEQGSEEKQDTGKKFVFPWKGIIKNVPVELKDGKFIGEGANQLKENLIGQGFKPLKVTPIWTYSGYTGCSVVDFGSDWLGFSNAIKFEKAFEVERRGRRWYKRRSHGDKLFGWVASEEDFHSRDPLGKHLQKFDLKSINDIEAEEERKKKSLVSQLQSTIEAKDLEYKVMESKLQAASISTELVIKESDAMIEAHNKEMRTMWEIQHNNTKRMLAEHCETISRIEEQKRWLQLRERELEKREAQNENEQRELSRKLRQNELAYQKQQEADMRKLKLAEEHKREKEALHLRIKSLRKEIDHKQAMELEVEHLKGALRVLKHVQHEDMEAKKKMEAIAEELEEREEELEAQEDFRQALIINEKKSKEELQEARKELINNLEKYSSKGCIGVKIVGALDAKPFEVGAMEKYSDDIASVKATEMWSLWESYLKDTNWHPFKFVSEEGITKEVIDEDDKRLKGLRNEVGEEAYNAVVTALIKRKESNPVDRTPAPEIWNIKEGRPAYVSEAAEHLVNIWKNQKRK